MSRATGSTELQRPSWKKGLREKGVVIMTLKTYSQYETAIDF